MISATLPATSPTLIHHYPEILTDINRLDHEVTNSINKDQLNDAIYNDPAFDTISSNLSSGTRDSLSVVNVSLQGGKKNRATTVSGIT